MLLAQWPPWGFRNRGVDVATAQVDAEEDPQYGPDNAGDEFPEELRRREQRLGKIQEAIERLRSRQAAEDRAAGRKEAPSGAEEATKRREFGEPPEKKQDNFTDPRKPDHKDFVGVRAVVQRPTGGGQRVAADSRGQGHAKCRGP